MPRILIIEDDAAFGQMLCRYLERVGYRVSYYAEARPALEALKESKFDLLLCDLRLPATDGISITIEVRKAYPEIAVVIMTGYADVDTAVSSMKKGAADYIAKPFTPEQLEGVLKQALAKPGSGSASSKVPESAAGYPATGDTRGGIRGVSEASRKLAAYLELVAPTSMSVLLVGESGTGKEVAAKGIHRQSKRSGGPFIAVDCGAIPQELAASEFFGHIKGSFTGAVQDKVGYFESARGGTLFLDEVGNLNYENQAQLLRALQERSIRRVGGNREIDVDVRILAATNNNLEGAVETGDFREDLYHRLNEFSIHVPALRDRPEDIPLFASFFLEQANAYLEMDCPGFEEGALACFQSYAWPGNLREFRNVVNRGVLLSRNDWVAPENLPASLREPGNVAGGEVLQSREDFERQRIQRALEQTNNNKSRAAKLLKITRKTLYNRINRYKLSSTE